MREKTIPPFAEVVRFHGHSCPGLALGYRICTAALEKLGVERPFDHGLTCVVENDACGVDAVQYVAGCSFGKGNLVFRDYGKQVYTFYDDLNQKALRFSAKFLRPAETDGEDITGIRNRMLDGVASKEDKRIWRRHNGRKIRLVLQSPEEDVFDVRLVQYVRPEGPRIHDSIVCEACGEKVMSTRIVETGGQKLCISCSKGEE